MYLFINKINLINRIKPYSKFNSRVLINKIDGLRKEKDHLIKIKLFIRYDLNIIIIYH